MSDSDSLQMCASQACSKRIGRRLPVRGFAVSCSAAALNLARYKLRHFQAGRRQSQGSSQEGLCPRSGWLTPPRSDVSLLLARGISWLAALAFTLVIGIAPRLTLAQASSPVPSSSSVSGNSVAPVRIEQVRVGWDGLYRVGRWTQVVAEVEVVTSGRFRLLVTTPDPDGHRVTFTSRLSEPLAAGRHVLRGLCKPGRLDAGFEVMVETDAEPKSLAPSAVAAWKSSSEKVTAAPKSLVPGIRLVLTVGEPAGFSSGEMSGSNAIAAETSVPKSSPASTKPGALDVIVLPMLANQLSDDGLAYDGVSLLVLSGPVKLVPDQVHALRDWIARGGRLALSLPTDPVAARDLIAPLATWLPATVSDEAIVVREFSSLESYAGRNVRVPFAGRLSIPQIRITHGVILAGSRDNALLARAPYGLGSVTVLALDLTQPPLNGWAGVGALGRRLLSDVVSSEDLGDSKTAKHAQLSSTGVTDLATQLHAIQDDFAGVSRVSPWFVMGLLGLFLILIGPVDYLLVHRLLKRPRATWITFPMWIVVVAIAAAQGAAAWNGTTLRVNQFHLINVDAATATVRSRLWTNLYSPVTTSVAAVEASTVLAGSTEEIASRRSLANWSGTPETAFGGMYRPAGIDIGRSAYTLANDLSQTVAAPVKSLPLVQWTSKELVTEVSGAATTLVESDLISSGSGRLTGTVTHRLPGALEDWLLVFGNRVYRQSKLRDDPVTIPLASRQLWRVEQPNVFQRELRPYLTGQITIATTEGAGKHASISHRQTQYDPLSLDAPSFARALTFHEEAGATKYTGLTNRLLEEEDLSHLIRLGRAVLFGRLKGSASALKLSDSTSTSSLQPVKPDREWTFVRLILPVIKVSEASRELESFDPNKQKP